MGKVHKGKDEEISSYISNFQRKKNINRPKNRTPGGTYNSHRVVNYVYRIQIFLLRLLHHILSTVNCPKLLRLDISSFLEIFFFFFAFKFSRLTSKQLNSRCPTSINIETDRAKKWPSSRFSNGYFLDNDHLHWRETASISNPYLTMVLIQ